ncbi:ATPase [Paenibacillus pasadenensis]|uniref:N-acetylglucosamine kinase n=1 Tax=Paenibacillus pasadenensis TaxID=217090 RepID=UPI00203D5BFD|nr:BadF/BadG/BcrA/BcrD ATPase family protein [Paenibacillus pasadenensis]MCM3747169.1 ATPase [Paenibacillus pasadenensis]
MSLYLGIDAGGTKTYGLLADSQGRLLGKGSAGNGNHQNGYEDARSNLNQAISQAFAQAGAGIEDVAHTCFGLAGADREADFRLLHPLVHSLGFTERYTIVCDTMIGLRAGSQHPYGVSVICGTGVNCAGLNRAGTAYQCGGFSYLFGDFGGGGGLCTEVFRTVIRAWDGREDETLLTPMLLEMLGYGSVQAMFDDYLDRELTVPVDATRLLFRAADKGDAAALRILAKQGDELALSVKAVIQKLGMSGDTFDVVLAGSLLTRGDKGWISGPIAKMAAHAAPLASLVKLDTEPVIGAVWAAIEADGQPVSAEMYTRMCEYREFNDIAIADTKERN